MRGFGLQRQRPVADQLRIAAVLLRKIGRWMPQYAIIARNGDIPGLTLPQTVHIPMALLCIFLWSFAATLFAMVILSRRK